ncbi:MAG: hypothetical protein WC539_04805 [Nitrospirota bacterium]
MDNLISLLDSRFHLEVIDCKSDCDITYHESISKDVLGIDHIHHLLSNSVDLFHSVNLPVALKLKNGKEYQMVARYWVLKYVLDNRKNQFPAIIFEDPELLPEVLKLEKLENEYFMRKESMPEVYKNVPKLTQKKSKVIKTQPASTSRATNRRHASKDSGRRCPFCPGPLAKATGKYNDPQGDLLTQDGPHAIKCGYNSNKYKCSFVATMTDVEFNDFKNTNKEFLTQEWLVRVLGKTCPVCGDEVYRRTIRKDNGKIEVWERCRKINQSRGGNCSWKTLIQ